MHLVGHRLGGEIRQGRGEKLAKKRGKIRKGRKLEKKRGKIRREEGGK